MNLAQICYISSLPKQSLNYSDDNQSLPFEPASVGKAQTVAAHIQTQIEDLSMCFLWHYTSLMRFFAFCTVLRLWTTIILVYTPKVIELVFVSLD